MTDETDAVFKALADPTRRRMLDSLNERSGQSLTELCAGLAMARQSVSKHLAILETANLVTTIRRGREKLHFLNPAPINDIGPRWINQYDEGRVRALSDLKVALEGTSMNNTAMDKREFVYKTYINTSPEMLWKGLTEPAFTSQYWGLELVSDWNVGSPITWELDGVKIADPEQVVLEADPFHRLVYTWHTFTPAWAEGSGFDEARRAQLAAEPRSRATFEIEPVGEMCKLTVVHEYFAPDSLVASMVSEGWPRVIAGLKTLLETGSVLPGRSASAATRASRRSSDS